MAYNFISTFQENTKGSDWVVGDIHGHFDRLEKALAKIKFNPKVDRLFSVGDMVDRGPMSDASLIFLAQPWFHAVQGNHEQMAIDWVDPTLYQNQRLYSANGGDWNIENSKEQQAYVASVFKKLPLLIEIPSKGRTVGIVHANIPSSNWSSVKAFLQELQTKQRLTADDDYDLEILRNGLLWDRSRIEHRIEEPVTGVDLLVVGHTPLKAPTLLSNVLHLDTAGWMPRGATGFSFYNISDDRTITIPN